MRKLFLVSLLASLGSAAVNAAPVQAWPEDPDSTVQAAGSYTSGQSADSFRRLEDAVRRSVGSTEARSRVQATLLKLLAPGTTFEAKKFACEQLAIVGTDASLPALQRLLNDEETSGLACFALTGFAPGKADAMLRQQLKWAAGNARIQIINTLGDRRDSKAVDPLAKDARGSELPLAQAAIAALGKIGTPAAWQVLSSINPVDPSLSEALDDATLTSAGAFAKSGKRKRAQPLYEALLAKSKTSAVRRAALSALLRLDADGGEERIVEVLSGSDAALKAVAIAAIPQVRSPWASESFAGEIHHLTPEEQGLLLQSLANRGDSAAQVALAKALSSPEAVVRRAAISALTRLGDPYFASLLARSATLANEADENRAIVAALVALRGGADTDRQLVAELKTALPKPRVQLIAAVARRQGVAANPVLLEETENTDAAVAKAAFRALSKSGTAADAPQLLAKLGNVREPSVRSEAESAAVQVLSRIQSPEERSAVLRAALAKASGSAETRAALVPLLSSCPGTETLSLAKEALSDAAPQVHDAAVRALSDWPEMTAWEPLLESYRQPEDSAAHSLALRGLVRLLGDSNARTDVSMLPRYRELFQGARSASDLKLILATLAGYPHPDALTLALPMLSNDSVRPEAIAAVRRIAEATKVQHPQEAEEALKRLPNP